MQGKIPLGLAGLASGTRLVATSPIFSVSYQIIMVTSILPKISKRYDERRAR